MYQARTKIETYEDVEALPDGIYPDIPSVFYHRLKYISASFLKRFRANPKESREPFEQTEAMILGSASHAYSLEGPEVFNEQYVIAPEFPCPVGRNPKGWKMTSHYKELKADFQEKNIGKTVLTAEQGNAVFGLDASLREHPTSAELMKKGVQELTIIWTDKATGLRCKARIDWVAGRGFLSDYKTTAQIDRFHYEITGRNYDIQAGHYSCGYEVHAEKVQCFTFVAGQTSSTYPVRVGYLTDEWLRWSIDESKRLLGLVAECAAAKRWPNFAIPGDIFSINQLGPHSLLEEWERPGRR